MGLCIKLVFSSMLLVWKYKLFMYLQGYSNLSLEGQSTAEFSSSPDQTRLPVIF